MGASPSREIILPAQTAAASEESASRAAASSALREAEASIYREGYARGRDDAVRALDAEIERAARAAFSRSAQEDVLERSQRVADVTASLRKAQYRAPQGQLECQAEERAVVACVSDGECATAVDAYERCAERTVGALMSPGAKRK